MKLTTKFITRAAIIAALYAALTFISSAFGLSSGAIQLRISEALCILPAYTPAAIPGLTIGCLIANIIYGNVFDVIFGTAATLIGALGTYCLRKNKILALFPPFFSNTIIIPFVLRYAYGADEAFWLLFLTVGLGELISVLLLGFVLSVSLNKSKLLLR